MLVVGHIHFFVSAREPVDGRFQIVLADRGTAHVFACHAVCRATVLAEIAFGIAHPRAGIYGVAQFLFGKFFPGNVDGSEPLQLFAVGTAANVNHQFIVQNLFLFIGLQVVEVAHVEGKVAIYILANADGALLAINDLERAVLTCCPIHDVEREALHDRVDNSIALFFLVDKFTLVRRADVQFPAIAEYAVLGIVRITGRQVANGDFLEFYLHGCLFFDFTD